MRRLVSLFVLVASLAQAQLQQSATSGTVNDYQTSVAVAAGATVILTSLTAHSKRLIGFEVWSSARYKAFVYTLANGIESASPAIVGGAIAFETYQWRTPAPDFLVLGNSAGVDAFEMKITNLDSTNSADVHCVFHYSN